MWKKKRSIDIENHERITTVRKKIIYIIACLVFMISTAACSANTAKDSSAPTATQDTNWSSWSSWQDDEITEDQDIEVETRTVYGYYYFSCPGCGMHYPAWDFACWECGATILKDSWHETFDTIPWSSTSPNWENTGRNSINLDGEVWFQWDDGGSKIQYRYRSS